MKNKKSQIFMLLLVVFTIISLVTLFFTLLSMKPIPEEKIGTKALAITNTYKQAEKILFYLDKAAEYSSQQAIYDMSKKGGFFEASECGKYATFNIWYLHGKDCFPRELSKQLKNDLNKYLNEYNAAGPYSHYLTRYYDLSFEGTTIKGIADNAFEIPIIYAEKGVLYDVESQPSAVSEYVPIGQIHGSMMSIFEVMKLMKNGDTFTVVDLDTGLSYEATAVSVDDKHVDASPSTAQDTEVLRKIFNFYGEYASWCPHGTESHGLFGHKRAIAVRIDGHEDKGWIAASQHGCAHHRAIDGYVYPRGSTIKDRPISNNFPGHLCYHFKDSRTHTPKVGPHVSPAHQRMVLKAAAMLSKANDLYASSEDTLSEEKEQKEKPETKEEIPKQETKQDQEEKQTKEATSEQKTTKTKQTPYDDLIKKASEKYGISEDLIKSQIYAESAFKPLAISPGCGAAGLIQLMPGTAKDLGLKNIYKDASYVTCNEAHSYEIIAAVKGKTVEEAARLDDRFDPAKNIDAGVKYLKQMSDMFGGDIKLALAAYNAGPARVKRNCCKSSCISFEQCKPRLPAQTQNYVTKILKGFEGDVYIQPTVYETPVGDVKVIGTYTATPSFSVDTGFNFNRYQEIIDQTHKMFLSVVSCRESSALNSCLSQELDKDEKWTYVEECISQEHRVFSKFIETFENCLSITQDGRCSVYVENLDSKENKEYTLEMAYDPGEGEEIPILLSDYNFYENLPIDVLYMALNPNDITELTQCTSVEITAKFKKGRFNGFTLNAVCNEKEVKGKYYDLVQVIKIGDQIAFADPNKDFSKIKSIRKSMHTTKPLCVKSEDTVKAYDSADKQYKERKLNYTFAIDFGENIPPEQIQPLEIFDMPNSKESIVIKLSENLDDDIDYYNVYYSKESELIISDMEVMQIHYNTIETVKNPDIKKLKPETLYNVYDTEHYYLIIMPVPEDTTYNFIITAVDVYGNEISEIGLSKAVQGSSINDLSP